MNNSRAFLHITYKLYGHLDKLSGVKKSHVLNCYLSLMKHAWKKNNYECGLRYSTVAKDTKLSRITVRRTIDTLEKLNIISTVRGKSGKTYKVNDIFLKSEQDGSILYIPKSKMYNLDHPYVKKRSVLVEALNINSIDTIIGKYKGDKDTIIDQLAKLPPEELNQDTKNPYYVKLAIEKKEENARSKNRKFVHPQKILNELIKIKKQSNPRYVEKVSFNKRNNLDYKGNPKKYMAGRTKSKVFCQAITRASIRLGNPKNCLAKGFLCANGKYFCRFHGYNNIKGFQKPNYTHETRKKQLRKLKQFKELSEEQFNSYYEEKLRPRIERQEKSTYYNRFFNRGKYTNRLYRIQDHKSNGDQLREILQYLKKKSGN
jgi:hypothetical protein